ncbi:MAG TPA: type VI secretion system tip protein VgrG [Chitinophagaceae bacterium]
MKTNDKQATDLVNLKLLVNKTALNAAYKIISIEVTYAFNKIASARVMIVDGDPAQQDFAISSKEDGLLPGNEFEIQLGYHEKSKAIFKGIIVKQSIKSGKNKKSFILIEARDRCVQLTLGRKSRCFFDKTDSELMEEIAKDSGFKKTAINIATTKTKHAEMVQYNVTDWDFIVCRAEMNSLLVLTLDNQLIIQAPDTKQQAVKEITYGKEVIEFESETDGRNQFEEVRARSWDYKEQSSKEKETASVAFKENGMPDGKQIADKMGLKKYELFHTAFLNEEQLQSWSAARLLKSRMAKATGFLRIKGTSDIVPGNTISLKGFGKRFNGTVLVSGIKHSYVEKGTWETEIRFGMDPEWFYEKKSVLEQPASGMVPGIQGLQIGIVVQINNDPEGEDRIKIQLPLVKGSENLWARVASLDAGKERGAFFRPEINDEVVVGFLDSDPRYPIILGTVHSEKKPAPIKATESNNEKGFVTRSKLQLIFNDEKKSVTLQTPKGKKLVIDDEGDQILLTDQHGNKITMGSSGIVLESKKDISFKSSTGSCKMEAMNVSIEATTKLKANGKASADFTSSGPTIVKGALVNIN